MRTLKFLATLTALVAVALGLYFGPQIAAHAHGASSTSSTGYVNADTLAEKLHQNEHSTARSGGAFLDDADLTGAHVVSAGQHAVR